VGQPYLLHWLHVWGLRGNSERKRRWVASISAADKASIQKVKKDPGKITANKMNDVENMRVKMRRGCSLR
jgi:hypothetical protein